MAALDPVQCDCITNACTRVRGRAGEKTRGYCRCRENGTACTYLCRCGTGRYACANSDYIEDDQEYMDDHDELHDPLFECGGEDEILSVYYGEDEYSIHSVDALNTSMQDLAVQQAEMNASTMISDAEEILYQDPTETKKKSKSSKGPRLAKGKKKSLAVQTQTQTKGKKKSLAVQTQTQTKGKNKSAKEQRKAEVERLTSVVGRLSTDGVEALVLTLVNLYPDLVEMAMGGDPPEPPPNTQPSGTWCKCGHCREMPTAMERLCCIKSENETCKLIVDAGPINHLVLSRTTLEAAVLNHNEYCVQNDDPNDNDTLRHMAYRKFVLWRRGYLGAGHRVVIPSCMVWSIRDKYPSPDGTYTGFKALIY